MKNIDIEDIAYEKYKLRWMMDHGKTISELIHEVSLTQEEAMEDLPLTFDIWETDYGFGSEIWACFDEFMESEYQDKEYMKSILTDEEYVAYLEDLEA